LICSFFNCDAKDFIISEIVLGFEEVKRLLIHFDPLFAHPRDTLDKYTAELANVTEQLFRFMAEDLGVDHEALLSTFEGLPQCVRINYYPPCRQADKVLGLSPHTDGVGMTLLLHVNDVQGLQIRKDGEWFSVQAQPGALVVNIGDVLEVCA
jgi:isopenicillin N synthase-like dioxygenase